MRLTADELQEALASVGRAPNLEADINAIIGKPEDLTTLLRGVHLALTVLEHGEGIEWCEWHMTGAAPNKPACDLGVRHAAAAKRCVLVTSLRIPLSALRDTGVDSQ